MIVAQDVIDAIDLDERPECAAAAIAIGQIAAPAARGAQLNRRGLFGGVPGKSTEFLGDFHLETQAAHLRRQWETSGPKSRPSLEGGRPRARTIRNHPLSRWNSFSKGFESAAGIAPLWQKPGRP